MKTISAASLLLVLLLTGCGSDTIGSDPSRDPTPHPTTSERHTVDGFCPEQFEPGTETPWVPHPPTTETPGRLAPDADPVEALLCRYTALTAEPSTLDGAVTLSSGLDRIRHDLLLPEKLPGESRPCTAIGGPHLPHLLYLRYADGDLWLSSVQDPNSCSDTGNGDFVSSVYLGERLAKAYDAGAWPAAPTPDGCLTRGAGRLGQERTLVPEGWESLLVCRKQTEPPAPREVDRGDAARVADLLNGLTASPDSGSCSGPSSTGYDLLFRYAEGPPVHLWWLRGCDPPLHNGSLQTTLTDAQSDELEALLTRP